MNKLILSLMMVILTMGMGVAHDVEAKRLGGGSSFGKRFNAPKKVRPAAAPRSQDAARNSAAANATKKKSGLGGMLGWLLAGGLFAALFLDGAFNGIQFMDILLLALLGFGIYMLMSRWKRSQVTPQYASAAPANTDTVPYQNVTEAAMPQATSQMAREATSSAMASSQYIEEAFVLPNWFNKEQFLIDAQQHFTHLQGAWDRQDWEDIATYTDVNLLTQLKAERAKSPDVQKTEVVSVMSELINFIDNQDHVITSIHFYGWIKEQQDQDTQEFSEIWHLSRDMQVDNSSWIIVGIEQA